MCVSKISRHYILGVISNKLEAKNVDCIVELERPFTMVTLPL